MTIRKDFVVTWKTQANYKMYSVSIIHWIFRAFITILIIIENRLLGLLLRQHVLLY